MRNHLLNRATLGALGLTTALVVVGLPVGIANHNAQHVNESEPNDTCLTMDQLAPFQFSTYTGTVTAANPFDGVQVMAYKSERLAWSVLTQGGNDATGFFSPSCPGASPSPIDVGISTQHAGEVRRLATADADAYTLQISITSNDMGTGNDAGGDFGSATALGGAANGPGALPAADGSRTDAASASDEDWYRVVVPIGGGLSVSMTPERSDFDLQVYNPGGMLRATSAKGGTDSESISCYGEAGGEWRVRVYPYGTARGGGYSLSISAISLALPIPCLSV